MIKVNGYSIDKSNFPDNTLALNVTENCYCIHSPFTIIEWYYDDDSEMFLLMCIVNILNRNGWRNSNIILKMPYLPNARMDRIKSYTENFSLKVFANWINSFGFQRIEVKNVHSNVSEALIDNINNVLPSEDIEKIIHHRYFNPDVIFFPDEGACKRYSDMKIIKELNLPIAFGIKKRDWKTGKILGLDIIGENLKGKKVLIIDDICSAGGTFYFSAKTLKEEYGVDDVQLYITHCENNILNGKLLSTDYVSKIYTTDSICTISDDKIKFLRKNR